MFWGAKIEYSEGVFIPSVFSLSSHQGGTGRISSDVVFLLLFLVLAIMARRAWAVANPLSEDGRVAFENAMRAQIGNTTDQVAQYLQQCVPAFLFVVSRFPVALLVENYLLH